jgi:membrane protein implicated in regulation of membrane protease activity
MVETITWLWLIAGILLIATELFLPGLVVCFLGAAAIIVAALRWFGLIPGLLESFTVWFVTSIVLLLGLRHFLLKWIPSESSYDLTDEDVIAVGSIVEVVETVSDSNKQGRIRFAGTTWPAITRGETLLAGQKAKLLYRDNLVWVVESHQELSSSAVEQES